MRTFQQYPLVNYIGQPFTKPISVFGVNGQSIPLTFNWLVYGVSTAAPNLVVQVDMGNSIVAQKINNIRSVYIDNTGSDVPIYIIFPDTNCVVVCQPNCTIWAPCYTAGMKALVAGLGFFTGDIPSTAITFTNLIVPPATNIEIQTAVDLWKASSAITRGNTIYNTNLGVPALGDQLTGSQFGITANNSQTIFNLGTGFIYITELILSISNAQIAANAGPVLGVGTAFFESTGVSGILVSPIFVLLGQNNASSTVNVFTEILRQHGNFKLDGSQLWRVRWVTNGNFSNGTLSSFFSYTTNPF
jgi:hypothetical protein